MFLRKGKSHKYPLHCMYQASTLGILIFCTHPPMLPCKNGSLGFCTDAQRKCFPCEIGKVTWDLTTRTSKSTTAQAPVSVPASHIRNPFPICLRYQTIIILLSKSMACKGSTKFSLDRAEALQLIVLDTGFCNSRNRLLQFWNRPHLHRFQIWSFENKSWLYKAPGYSHVR